MSEFTINVVVTTGGTIDADLSNVQTVNVDVVQGGEIAAEITGGGRGPQGEQGEQGETGETGATGATGAGVPNGGTVGQILRKLSGTDQDTAWHTPVKADVGLSNADNTSDANKPISSATQTALDGKQTLDSDLTAIAALTPSNDDIIQRKAGAWTNRTVAQYLTDLGLAAIYQPLDADLTTIAALDSSTAGAMTTDGAGWIRKTYAQLKTALSLVKADVGLGNVDNTSDANKPVSTATQTALDAKVAGPASVTDDLPAIFDGTTGKLIKSKTYAAFKTLLSLVKGDVGLGNVDNVQQQPIDQDLTDIAALSPSNDDIMQRKAGAWTNRTLAQILSDLAGVGTTFQPLDSDLTTIAGLTATTDNFMVATASAWASRTPTQARSQMGLGSIALLATITEANITLADNTTNDFSTARHGFVPKGTNVGDFLKDDGTWDSIPGGGDALTSNPLSQFAATTSLQLKGVMSDETGSGALVFATSPTLVTPILGTPTSGTLTNATGLPLTGLVNDTTTALGVGSLNLGHASDTTLTRSAAGKLAVEGVDVVLLSGAQTLTDKTLTAPIMTAPVLGTPASGVATNLTGTAAGLTAGNVTTNANLTGDVTSVGNATTIGANTVESEMLDLTIGVKAYRNGAASYSTEADIVFDTEIFDDGGDFNTTTGIFTAPVTGRYSVYCQIRITDLGDTNTANLRLYGNGVVTSLATVVGASAGGDPTIVAADYMILTAGQEIKATMNISTSKGLSPGATSCFILISYLGS